MSEKQQQQYTYQVIGHNPMGGGHPTVFGSEPVGTVCDDYTQYSKDPTMMRPEQPSTVPTYPEQSQQLYPQQMYPTNPQKPVLYVNPQSGGGTLYFNSQAQGGNIGVNVGGGVGIGTGMNMKVPNDFSVSAHIGKAIGSLGISGTSKQITDNLGKSNPMSGDEQIMTFYYAFQETPNKIGTKAKIGAYVKNVDEKQIQKMGILRALHEQNITSISSEIGSDTKLFEVLKSAGKKVMFGIEEPTVVHIHNTYAFDIAIKIPGVKNTKNWGLDTFAFLAPGNMYTALQGKNLEHIKLEVDRKESESMSDDDIRLLNKIDEKALENLIEPAKDVNGASFLNFNTAIGLELYKYITRHDLAGLKDALMNEKTVDQQMMRVRVINKDVNYLKYCLKEKKDKCYKIAKNLPIHCHKIDANVGFVNWSKERKYGAREGKLVVGVQYKFKTYI